MSHLASMQMAQAERRLGSGRPGTRQSAIAALRQIMRTQPSRQPTVIQVLSTFIDTHSRSSPSGNDPHVAADIQAALTVLAHRNPARDGGAVVNLDNADLTGADLAGAYLAGASLAGSNGADLTGADLTGANLRRADLANAYLGGASLAGADLSGADLDSASLYQTPLCTAGGRAVHPAWRYNCHP